MAKSGRWYLSHFFGWGAGSNLNSNSSPMSTRYTLICAILGTDVVFTITLDDTPTVADLKKEIKATNENTIASFDARRLTLYKVKLRVSELETFREVMEDISRDSIYGEELDYPFSKLLETFKESDLPEKTIHVLVRFPAGESTNPRVRGAVAESLRRFTTIPRSQRSKWCIYMYLYHLWEC